MAAQDPPLRYRLLTGEDDADFDARVSAALEEGYVLHGSPVMTTTQDDRVKLAQALVWPVL